MSQGFERWSTLTFFNHREQSDFERIQCAKRSWPSIQLGTEICHKTAASCCLQISGSMDPFSVSICVRLCAAVSRCHVWYQMHCTWQFSIFRNSMPGASEAGVKILDESAYSGHLRFNYSPMWLTKTCAELERGRSLFLLITGLVIAWYALKGHQEVGLSLCRRRLLQRREMTRSLTQRRHSVWHRWTRKLPWHGHCSSLWARNKKIRKDSMIQRPSAKSSQYTPNSSKCL